MNDNHDRPFWEVRAFFDYGPDVEDTRLIEWEIAELAELPALIESARGCGEVVRIDIQRVEYALDGLRDIPF